MGYKRRTIKKKSTYKWNEKSEHHREEGGGWGFAVVVLKGRLKMFRKGQKQTMG
jgi:hypothetical protein